MVAEITPGMEVDSKTGLHVPLGTRDRTWQCRKGHRYSSEKAFTMALRPGVETSALCPKCVRTWMERQFGARKVTPS